MEAPVRWESDCKHNNACTLASYHRNAKRRNCPMGDVSRKANEATTSPSRESIARNELANSNIQDFAIKSGSRNDENDAVSAGNRQEEPNNSESDDDATRSSPPPLPPRPTIVQADDREPIEPTATVSSRSSTLRPRLPTQTTTAVSLTDAFAQNVADNHQEGPSSLTSRSKAKSLSEGSKSGLREDGREGNYVGSRARDPSTTRSVIPTLEASNDLESLLGEVLSYGQETRAWKLLNAQLPMTNPWKVEFDEDDGLENFEAEFGYSESLDSEGGNEG